MKKGNETRKGQIMGSKIFLAMMVIWIYFLGSQATCFAETVGLSWDASSGAAVTGYKIYYKADSSSLPFTGTGAVEGASPIDVHNALTSTVTGLDPNKTYYFTITAYDATGLESDYSNIVTIAETVAPTISITSPVNNATASGTVSITASATDNVAVASVAFYVNGVLQSSDTTTPYMYSWNTSSLASGTYTIYAKAYDAAGNVGQSANVSVNVINDTTPPAVSITAPVNNATVSGSVAISASAIDTVGVTKVEFYENGVLLSASNIAPYSYTWNTTTVANGSYTLTAKAYDNAGNVGQSGNIAVTVNNIIPDTTAPAMTAFTMPTTATSLTVAISSLTASDAAGVSGYLVSESASAPAASATGWTASAPTSFTFSAAGAKTAYAWAKDAAGNISSSLSSSVTITLPDTTAPAMTAFTMPTTATSLTVAISSLTASDAAGVTGYLVSESASAPAASATGWTASAPTSFTFSAAGAKTAYAWAKDAAGNVSSSLSRSVTITLPDTTAPAMTAFTMPTTATSLTVAISSLTASDAAGVTGYLVSESASAPAASATGWTASAPTSFTFSAAGAKTAYAWAKDAAGNISSSLSSSVTITLPDTTAPAMTAFTMPTTATSLTVAISSLTASDAAGVTGYLVSESASAPAASATGWTASAPTSFTFSAAGAKTAYAWAKDAAGNISSSLSRSVTITLPDTTAPAMTAFTMPTTATSLTVAISSLTASDAAGVSGYLVSESASAPAASATGWTASAPTSFTFSAAGAKTAYAWAKDAAGNISSSLSSSVTITLPDTTAPAMTAFTMPTTATSLTVAISSLTASDAAGVSGYLVSESASAPAASATGWTASAPTSFTFSAAGAKTAYAWAKDAAGNISSSLSSSVTITLPDTTAPAMTAFTMPTTATSLTVAISSLTASDAAGVTGYLVSESASAPAASATGWTASAPTSFTFSAAGAKTAYAWAKDAAGNVSSSLSRSVTITLPDTTAPAMTAFTMPTTATSLTVAISSLTASDAAGVTGYLVSESASAPAASATGWTASAPTSFTFSAAGAKTAYAWAKDAAGNISSSLSSSVTITLPDTTAPAVTINQVATPTTATTMTLSGSVSDNTSVANVKIQVGSGPVATAAISGNVWTCSLSGLTVGTNLITVKATDTTGNVSSASTSIVVESSSTPTAYTLNDAILAMNIAVGRAKATSEQMTRLDVAPVVNGTSVPNGKIDTGDVIVILSKLVGK